MAAKAQIPNMPVVLGPTERPELNCAIWPIFTEASWDEGCRGYWYSTAGHGYCQDATDYPSYGYYSIYDCNNEIDTQHYDTLYQGYVGKFDTHECTFKINKTDVHN